MQPITPSWGQKRKWKLRGQLKNWTQVLSKKTKAEFLADKKKTLTDSGKDFWILAAQSHTLVEFVWKSVCSLWMLGVPWFHWLAAYSVDINPSKSLTCLQLLKWRQLAKVFHVNTISFTELIPGVKNLQIFMKFGQDIPLPSRNKKLSEIFYIYLVSVANARWLVNYLKL